MARRTAIACLALLSSPSFAAHVANRHATRRLQNSEVGVGDSAYKIMSTSSCPTGWEPVTDVTECNYAAQELSLPRTNAQETQRSDWPRGCFWLQSYGGWLYWDEDGTEGEPGSQYQAVCEKIAPKCHGVTCAAHGWCNVHTSGKCACQNIYGGADCSHELSTKNVQMYPGPNCALPLGPLRDERLCNAAAKQMGLPNTVAFVDNDTISPIGCWWNTQWNLLTFNYLGSPTCKFDDVSTICLKVAPTTRSPTAWHSKAPTKPAPPVTKADCSNTHSVQNNCGNSAGKMPDTCTTKCAYFFTPWYKTCGATLTDDSLHTFFEMCSEPVGLPWYQDPSYNLSQHD